MNSRTRKRLVSLHVEQRWRSYSTDPELFLRECVQVPAGERLGAGKGRVNLELWDYQEEVLNVFLDNRYIVILKARQLGLTTIAMAYAFWMLMFRPGSNIVLVSKNQDTANKALELIDFMWQFLPESIKTRAPALESNAAKHHTYLFPDGMRSQITSYAATRTVAAGQTANLVIWDEAALAEAQEDVLRTLLPTTDAGGQLIVFSTARGGHNMFARLFNEARIGANGWRHLFYPWHHSRLLSQDDYEARKITMKDEPWRFYAEHPSSMEEAFRQSGRNRFPNLPPEEEAEPYPLRVVLEPRFDGSLEPKIHQDGPFACLGEFIDGTPAGCRSVIAIDPAAGVGGDYTAVVGGWIGRDGVPVRAVSWHQNMVEPVEVAIEAAQLGRFLADETGMDALLVVERQGGWGETIIHELRENLAYNNLYRFKRVTHRRAKVEDQYGFPMTSTRRPLVIDALAQWVNADGEILRGLDPLLRSELGAFVIRDDGRVMADLGMNDDLVMATAIWLYVCQNQLPATEEPIREKPSEIPVYSVNSLFEEAEKIRQFEERRTRLHVRRRH